MNFIVTTTIHSPTEAILKFCNKADWTFIIVGDLKTPHSEYLDLERRYENVKYLTPTYQDQKYYELSGLLQQFNAKIFEQENVSLICK